MDRALDAQDGRGWEKRFYNVDGEMVSLCPLDTV